jgi:hypothetical protein
MTRARINLDDFDETPPNKDPAVLREISEDAGFPSRPAVPPAPAAPAVERPAAVTFERPARATGNRNIAINVRVPPETATRIYALRDSDPTRARVIADVIEEAIDLLFARRFESNAAQ